jgi:hypothetical protein
MTRRAYFLIRRKPLALPERFVAIARRRRSILPFLFKTDEVEGESLDGLVGEISNRGLGYRSGDTVTTIPAYVVGGCFLYNDSPVGKTEVESFHKKLVNASPHIPVNPQPRI